MLKVYLHLFDQLRHYTVFLSQHGIQKMDLCYLLITVIVCDLLK